MNNSDILGEEAAVRQLVSGDFSATNGHFEDDSVKTLRKNAFYGKTSIKSVSFPSATEIQSDVFRNCTNLTEINLRALTTIDGGNIFYGVKAPLIFPELTTYPGLNAINSYGGTLIDLGTKIGRIESFMFSGDSNLVTLVLRKATVPELSSVNAFNSTKYATNGAGGAYVYVPRDLISSYQSATNWATLYAAHSDMFRALEDYTVDGTTTGEFELIDYTVAGTGLLMNDGTVGNNTTYNYTDFFDVESGTTKIKSIATGVSYMYCQFFNGDTFIERVALSNGCFIVPSGATKARFCWNPNTATDVNVVRQTI